MHPIPCHCFNHIVRFLAIGKHIEYGRHTACILNKGTDKEQVISDTEKLTHHDANGFSARGNRDTC